MPGKNGYLETKGIPPSNVSPKHPVSHRADSKPKLRKGDGMSEKKKSSPTNTKKKKTVHFLPNGGARRKKSRRRRSRSRKHH